MVANPFDINHSTVQSALEQARTKLRSFAANSGFQAQMEQAFGSSIDASQFQQAWQQGEFGSLPELEILPAVDINNALGAYAAETETVYLAEKLVNEYGADAVTRVFLEEFGHHVDAQLSNTDTDGDEGAIFSALALGQELNQQQISNFQSTSDLGVTSIGGKEVIVETFFGGLEDTIKDSTTETLGDITDKVQEATNEVIDASGIDSLADSAGDIVESVEEKIGSSIDTTGAVISNVQGYIEDSLNSTLDALLELGSSLPDIASDLSSDLLDSLPDFHVGTQIEGSLAAGPAEFGLGGSVILDTSFQGDTPGEVIVDLLPDVLANSSASVGVGLGGDLSAQLTGGLGLTEDLIGFGGIGTAIVNSVKEGIEDKDTLEFESFPENLSKNITVNGSATASLGGNFSLSWGLPTLSVGPSGGANASLSLDVLNNTFDTGLKYLGVGVSYLNPTWKP
jgi:vacuolar-type H+-ATPase subunit E/Vma4